MSKSLLLLPAALFCAFFSRLAAQSFLLSYQNPDQLAVCSADTLRITVQNNTAFPVDTGFLDLALPPGLEYRPGTVSGAAESDISNLQKPVLALPVLAPGAAATIQVQLYASCGLVPAINSGQLFKVLLRARAGIVLEELTTTAFQVQTSLLVITQIVSDSFSGVSGSVVTRTIHVRNTRLGPVKHLFLHDNNDGYLDIHIPGAATEQNLPLHYSAYFDSTFFTAFGDGDEWLEFGETALITEEITLQPCLEGVPTTRSYLDVGWSCTPVEASCQSDTAYADIVILPAPEALKLVILGKYPLGWDHCAQLPSNGSIQLYNLNTLTAKNVFITLTTIPVDNQTGIDPNSLRLVAHGVQNALPASVADTIELTACGVTYAKSVSFYVPEVGALDSVEILFQTYYCSDACAPPVPVFFASFNDLSNCDAQYSDVKIVQRQVDNLLADVYYNIGTCLQDGQTYDFRYVLQSERLLADTGYLWLNLDLPHGLFWSADCPPVLGGKMPLVFTLDSVFTTHPVQRVRMAFELPLNTAYPELPFCLRSSCIDNAVFVPQPGIDGPDSAGNFTAYQTLPGDNCGHCGFPVHAEAKIARQLDSNYDCAWPTCDDFRLRTECERADCGSDVVAPDSCPVFREHHTAVRTNFGLPDNDDDRVADGAGVPDMVKIRRDRLLAGDTLQAVLSTKILCGDSIGDFFYQLFTETVQSDYGYGNALDTFEIGPKLTNTARQHLANRDSFQVIGATFTVWDSSANAVYTCPVNPGPGGANRHYGLISPVNVKPSTPADQLATMSYAFRPSLAGLAAAGCLPPGLLLESGDSVALIVEYKLAFNFVPFSYQHRPPLVNFEMGFNANRPEALYNYRRFDTLMFQYTGVWDSLSHAQYSIKACEPSQGLLPFGYVARVARENLFPFEVRPLNLISDYKLTIPPGATLVSSELAFLTLQENTPRLQNFPLPYTISNDTLDIDFGPAYASPTDEGYALQTRTIFAPNCKFNRPARSDQRVIIDWNGCIQMPDPDTTTTLNVVGFLANAARDTMTTDELVIDFPTAGIQADVFIKNKAPVPAPNYWIELLNPEGGLSDLAIQGLQPAGPVLLPVNGVIQLGTLPSLGEWVLRIFARNNTCAPQHLQVIYGWDCASHTQAGAPSCTRRTLEFLFRPQNPEIELELQQIPAEAPLCDSSDYIVFEISNAELGYAYKPFATVELPAGFQLLPGSCQLAYPAGSAFVPVADPAALGGNIFEWNLAALQAAVATNGLPGVDLEPQNALQIRFKVLTGCGVLSSAQLVFGARAEWSCGLPTNILRKAGDPLSVGGLTPAYQVQIGLTEQGGSNLSPCNTVRTMAVTLLVSGTTLPGDSIYVALPNNFTYVDNSYQPGSNASPGEPFQNLQGLRWPIPAGLPANTAITFTFQIKTAQGPDCTESVLKIQTRQSGQAFCPLISSDCAVYAVTGEASYSFPPPGGGVVLTGASLTITAGGKANYVVSVFNGNSYPVPVNLLQFFRDLDHDGQFTAADSLQYSIGNLNQTVLPGDTLNIVVNGLPAPADPCHLLAILPVLWNCLCPEQAVPVLFTGIDHAAVPICPGDSILVGIPGAAGHTYFWPGVPGLSCDTCAQFIFMPADTGQYRFTLLDIGGNCPVEHFFEVEVVERPMLITPDTAVCRGQTVSLQTSPASSWNWTGPGGASSNAPVFTVQALQTGTYTVIATNTAGCTLIDSVTVTVLPADTVDLGIRRTCEGTPVDVFGTPTDQAGVYRQTLSNAAGCDSLLVLTLEVAPNTEEDRDRCPGVTLEVFGAPVTAAGTYCKTFVSSLGCDSMHCVVVTDLPAPALPDPDTFYFEQGTSVQLPSPGDFTEYHWAPADSLSCTACPNPVASPTDTTDYVVTVKTTAGCTDTLVYRVVPFPPCDPGRIIVPNAFTPNGDNDNDVFTVVPYEGTEIIERLTIYNRWGQKIHVSSGPNAFWDGTTDGKPAPSELYVWVLEVLCAGEERGVRRGDVTLLR